MNRWFYSFHCRSRLVLQYGHLINLLILCLFTIYSSFILFIKSHISFYLFVRLSCPSHGLSLLSLTPYSCPCPYSLTLHLLCSFNCICRSIFLFVSYLPFCWCFLCRRIVWAVSLVLFLFNPLPVDCFLYRQNEFTHLILSCFTVSG